MDEIEFRRYLTHEVRKLRSKATTWGDEAEANEASVREARKAQRYHHELAAELAGILNGLGGPPADESVGTTEGSTP